jgi:hypothetical protein
MLSPGDCVCAGGMPNGPEPNVLLGVGAMMGLDSEGTQRTLSAYNLFVREMLRQFKEQTPDMPQVCRCRTARDRHRSLAPSAAAHLAFSCVHPPPCCKPSPYSVAPRPREREGVLSSSPGTRGQPRRRRAHRGARRGATTAVVLSPASPPPSFLITPHAIRGGRSPSLRVPAAG